MKRLANRYPVGIALACGFAVLPLNGCQLFGFIAASAEDLPKTVKPEYTDLTGKSYAVYVTADRATQAEFSRIPPELTTRITKHLFEQNERIAAAGYVPAKDIIATLSDQPRLLYLPRGELMDELEVDRLIFVEIDEFRLTEEGNRYVWDGVATGRVQVYERDHFFPDEAAYEKSISVRFPDGSGYTEADLSADNVASVLVSRFSNRASWLFYEHKEDPKAGYE